MSSSPDPRDQEILTVVDRHDRAKGPLDRDLVHERGLWHRTVGLVLLGKHGRIPVQERGDGRLTYIGGGHVESGETRLNAVVRETKEEVGQRIGDLLEHLKLRKLGTHKVVSLNGFPAPHRRINRVFAARTDVQEADFTIVDGNDIKDIRMMTRDQLDRLMQKNPKNLTKPFLTGLRLFLGKSI